MPVAPDALEGRVALVTGAARGQGRAHARALAEVGADLILLDACGRVAPTGYPPATPAELEETVASCTALGRKVESAIVDLRDGTALRAALDPAAERFGRLDVVVANAGVAFFRPFLEMTDEDWDVMIGNNLTSVQRTLSAAVPHMVSAGNGGSIVLTSSVAGLKVIPYETHYTAAKHGVVGVMRALAVELADHRIRVKAVAPGGVATAMGQDPDLERIFGNEQRAMTFEKSFSPLLAPHMAQPEEIAELVRWLAADVTRAITGQVFAIDYGATAR